LAGESAEVGLPNLLLRLCDFHDAGIVPLRACFRALQKQRASDQEQKRRFHRFLASKHAQARLARSDRALPPICTRKEEK